MSDNKIKVVGYSKKIVYNDNIEYRPFSPDLVGLQTTSLSNTPLFTMGNFAITTNTDSKTDKDFSTNAFSSFVSLEDLNLTVSQAQTLLSDNTETILNLDKRKLTNYALFGSLTEFVRVSLEDIIIKWPASLFLYPRTQTDNNETINGFTYENYVYDFLTNTASFKVNTTFVNNKFDINYLVNGSIADTYNATNNVRNLTVNYLSYVILYNGLEYPLTAFSGSTYKTNDYIYLKVTGDVFSGLPTSNKVNYHIKPNKDVENLFFNSLPDFEYYLLSRDVSPLYTATFSFPVKSDIGLILYTDRTVTWPVSDGYNIDFETTQYVDYATSLLEIASTTDLYSSNLLNRFLVTESISDFDTTPVHLSEEDKDTSGQKMNKTLQIYGREYDEINNFISGIQFANTVTYDKNENTPDKYLKGLATVLGWDLTSSLAEDKLISTYTKNGATDFSGQSVGLTPSEADIELWRRIILNTPWIWKSKGARKSVEFLLRFIGAPQGLVKFNEYIYKADAPIDVALFSQLLDLNGLDTDLSVYPIDSDGYPRIMDNTDDLYFQCDGGWYRQTGGPTPDIDVQTGNNPHIGPYDSGSRYINQFNVLIPNFSATTITSQTITTNTDVLYLNNDLGTFDSLSANTVLTNIHLLGINNQNINNRYGLEPIVGVDPNKTVNNCGCPVNVVDNIATLCVSKKDIIPPTSNNCGTSIASYGKDLTDNIYVFNLYQYDQNGEIIKDSNGNPLLRQTNYINSGCCSAIGGTPYLYDTVVNGVIINSGFFCGDNTITPIVANNDLGTPISGAVGGVSVQNVLFNDTLNGSAATFDNVILSFVSSTDPKITLNTTNGSVNVEAGIADGDYELVYRICERRNPSNCAIGTVSIPVPAGEVIYVDADYIVFTYEFTDGQDLDTRTRIVTPDIGQDSNTKYLGWGKLFAYPNAGGWTLNSIPPDAIIDWAGDNTGVGFESVFVDLVKFRAAYPTEDTLVVDFRAFWYNIVGHNPAFISAKFYKGGTMVKGGTTNVNGVIRQTYQYYNPTATSVTTYEANGKIVTLNNTPANQLSGERVTTFTFNFLTNIGVFNNNDTTTPSV